MEKWKRVTQDIFKHSIQVLLGIQMVLGLLWMAGNFMTCQDFPQTRELLEIAGTFVTDEYFGILYPCLIRGAQGLASFLPVPYYMFLYAVQLGAGYYALRKLTGRFSESPWIPLWIMTIPVVAQFYLAVLPQSLAVSALVLCIDQCVGKKWGGAALCWLLSGLLLPEYFLFGAAVYLLFLVRSALGDRRELLRGLLCILVLCLIAGTVGFLTVEPHSRGRMARTPAAMALRRVVWPNFAFNEYFWGEEVKSLFSEEKLAEISSDPEKVSTEFGYLMEEAYGVGPVQGIYWKMALDSFRIGTKDVVKSIAGDFLGYSCPPAVLLLDLGGLGVSFNGWNYGRMAEQNPVLTKYYVYSSGITFPALFLLALVGFICRRRKIVPKDLPGTRTESLPGTCSEIRPESLPGTCSEIRPGSLPGTRAGVCPESLPGTCSEICPESLPRTCSEICPENLPGTCSEICPKNLPGTRAGVCPESLPGTRPRTRQRICQRIRLIPGIFSGLAWSSLLLVLWNTLSAAGMRDYKNGILVSIAWGIWILYLLEKAGWNTEGVG